MPETHITKNRFDLEDRTFLFAKNISLFCRMLPRTVANIEYHKQIVRSSASVGANYIEANESLGKKDFILHLKISRKEAKETLYWLRLIDTTNDNLSLGTERLMREATELRLIFSAIIKKAV